MTHTTNSEAETMAVASRLAVELTPGEVVALYGGLGAGKTAFVRGLAQGLGIAPEEVSSPTFALVNEYRREGQKTPVLCHFDMYRVMGEEGVESTGFFDYPSQGCILAVEWSENIREYLPPQHLAVTIQPGEGENTRQITVERRGGSIP